MMGMSEALGLRWTRRTGQVAGGALRICVALWMVFHIAHTPIHLHIHPHCEDWQAGHGAGLPHSADCIVDETHHGDDHHDRHPAAQHKFKVTQPTRAMVVEMVSVQAAEWVKTDQGFSQPEFFDFSGLSPPELARTWQFIFRAALPVRAPSLLS